MNVDQEMRHLANQKGYKAGYTKGYRAGVEAMRDAVIHGLDDKDAEWIVGRATRLLAESSKQMEEKP